MIASRSSPFNTNDAIQKAGPSASKTSRSRRPFDLWPLSPCDGEAAASGSADGRAGHPAPPPRRASVRVNTRSVAERSLLQGPVRVFKDPFRLCRPTTSTREAPGPCPPPLRPQSHRDLPAARGARERVLPEACRLFEEAMGHRVFGALGARSLPSPARPTASPEPGSQEEVGRSALLAEARPTALRGAFAPGSWTLESGRIGPRTRLRRSGQFAARRSENATFR